MNVIRNADGEVIRQSRNLRGIREYMGHNRVKVMSIDPMRQPTLASLTDTSGGKLCILFVDGSSFEANFASYTVLRDWVRRRRNAYGSTLRVAGEDAGTVSYRNPHLRD